MNDLIKVSFGSTSAIVTSMALIVGLGSLNNTRSSLIAALLIIAIADNIADTFSIHIFQESSRTIKPVKNVVISNYIARLIISFSFIPIVIYLPSPLDKIISVIWGLLLLSFLSYLIAKVKHTVIAKEISYHTILALVVILVSQLLGFFIKIMVK